MEIIQLILMGWNFSFADEDKNAESRVWLWGWNDDAGADSAVGSNVCGQADWQGWLFLSHHGDASLLQL